MAEVCPSGRAVVRNPEPTEPIFIRACQADFYLSDVLVPCVADHFGEQKDLVLLPKGFAKTFFVDFEPMILHRFALFCPMYGRLWVPSGVGTRVSRCWFFTHTQTYCPASCNQFAWHFVCDLLSPH